MGAVSAVQDIRPEQVGRATWELKETARDVRVLGWVGRFRFVTAEALGAWLGVSVQKARLRVRRLERAGLLDYRRHRAGEAWLVYLSNRGTALLGLPRRAAPRLDLQREHELAIVALATQLERHGEQVLTERECRRLERRGEGRFSVEVPQSQRNEARRWPDLVIDRAGGPVAVEIELSPKTSGRLGRIVSGYGSSRYAEVVFLVGGESLRRRIEGVIERERETVTWRELVPLRAVPIELACLLAS